MVLDLLSVILKKTTKKEIKKIKEVHDLYSSFINLNLCYFKRPKKKALLLNFTGA